MSERLTSWTGDVRGTITEYGLSKVASGAVVVNITVAVFQYWDTEAEAWQDCDYETTGGIWIVKKDGSLDQRKVKALIDHAGWDGDFTSIVQHTWQPTPCSFTIEQNKDREGRPLQEWVTGFMNAYDRTPGARGNATPDDVRALQAQYGSALRALAGNAKRQTVPPTNKPVVPPPSPPKGNGGSRKPLTEQTPTERQQEVATDGDPIPFGFWWIVPLAGIIGTILG